MAFKAFRGSRERRAGGGLVFPATARDCISLYNRNCELCDKYAAAAAKIGAQIKANKTKKGFDFDLKNILELKRAARRCALVACQAFIYGCAVAKCEAMGRKIENAKKDLEKQKAAAVATVSKSCGCASASNVSALREAVAGGSYKVAAVVAAFDTLKIASKCSYISEAEKLAFAKNVLNGKTTFDELCKKRPFSEVIAEEKRLESLRRIFK